MDSYEEMNANLRGDSEEEHPKACPFCGNEAEVEKCEHTDPLYVVTCQECDFSLFTGPSGIGWFNNKKDAIASWNRRA